MKKLSTALLIVALLTGINNSAWGQASTQGKEFWVSSSLACSPEGAGNAAAPYIAISAEKACTVTITGGLNNTINITQPLAAGSWSEFGHNSEPEQRNPQSGRVYVNMDASKWYPVAMDNANNVSSLAGQKNMYGLHITATEKISVYVILSAPYSMDASNILPLTALGSEYYTQDYWSKVKSDFADAVGLTTILGTEDNTTIDITPNGNTFDGHSSGQTYQITLNQGQTYYLVTEKGGQLAGTHISARDGKKIAVYCGVPLTNVPTGIAARDCLFEQPMPLEYWGTQFIATRSLEKNGNLIGITATVNGTELKVDGYTQAYINEGETFYIMLQASNNPNGNKPGDSPIDMVLTQDVAYIETSCPCAVYSYDTGNSYKGKDGDEINNGKGDPSSVWVSPIQQKINKITFGTCYTTKTKDHFLNVVTETATCQNTVLTAMYGATKIDKSSLLTWQPVPGNPTYSYARAKIGDANTEQFSVFSLENPKGFNAIVYGNGEDESYAYSAGSAAVERGVSVNGETFTNGYTSDTKFCVDNTISFDAKVGTDEITRVDWDFGDGITETNGEAQTSHLYTSPGWYDVRADLYGHQVCTDESNQFLGKIQFSFRVVRADTVLVNPTKECLDTTTWQKIIADYGQDSLNNLLANGKTTIINPDAPCYEDRQLSFVSYGLETAYYYDHEAQDSCFLNGQWYYISQEVTWRLSQCNMYGCDSIITCNLHVITCLDMQFVNDSAAQHACLGDESISVEYSKTKGDIKKLDDGTYFARFVVPGYVDDTILMSNDNTQMGYVELPISAITQPGKYKGQLIIEDENGCETKTFVFDIAIYYPNDIFKYKFNNVLAVYKSGFGGNDGYQFKAYQWYLNGNPIEGATSSTYYLGDGVMFSIGDKVYVELTDMSGITLPSCEQTITSLNPEPQQAPARKMLVGQQFVIRLDDTSYNIYGQKIQ